MFVVDIGPGDLDRTHIVSFGENKKAEARLVKCMLQPRSSTVEANILGHEITYKVGAPGRPTGRPANLSLYTSGALTRTSGP